jgi:hypothetical protein
MDITITFDYQVGFPAEEIGDVVTKLMLPPKPEAE